jgi:pyruvate dehydrogenase E2 component (dihydrolipoamide acetyltransferase)
MPTNVLMPALSPTMTEGTLAKWLKKEGDMIKSGDVIAEIETDKATMEVEAADEGQLGKIMVAAGTAGVKVNEVIAVLLSDGEALGTVDVKKVVPTPVTSSEPQKNQEVLKKDAVMPAVSAVSSQAGQRIFVSPLARRLAADKNIDLTRIKGSGPHGRIVRADLDQAPMAVSASSKSSTTKSGSGLDVRALADAYGMSYTAQPNSAVRKVIANRLLESKQTMPHFYLTIDCIIDGLLAARKDLNDKADGKFKLSVNDFVIKAVAMALKAYPAANVAWTDDAILQFDHADVSVAVATPNGLITPIIKAAETKGLAQISSEMKDLAGRARDGKLKPAEFQGGTFSISNLGMYGIKDFGAIINPPQACILAVGAGIEQPVVKAGKIEIATVMSCTLSVDHRAVDGAVGAEFLQIFKRYIENPVSMLV